MRHIVIGTAGHIDHGKSALVKALTGVDPDRLKEEKERGMTTDLGFVFYGDEATIIDVPGHEKFVRHMVAGAATIDLVLFVIAADDGLMPQTYEHFEILNLLGIKAGIIVITKIDLVNKQRIIMLLDEIKALVQGSFLENAPVVLVSNVSGEGISELKSILDKTIKELPPKIDHGVFRMPIDRVFTIKGFGTIVCGTVLSGKIKIGDELELLPQKRLVKVRNIEVHNKPIKEVITGFRAAINLSGVEKDEVARGDVLAWPGFFEPSLYINASLYILSAHRRPVKNFERLRIHIGTKELLGRAVLLDRKVLMPQEKALVQFRLETPAVCALGDRFVVRTYSPPTTIGGGVIVDPKAEKIKSSDEELLAHLISLEKAENTTLVNEKLLRSIFTPLKPQDLAWETGLSTDEIKNVLKELIHEKKAICIDERRELYYHSDNFIKLKDKILEAIKNYHSENPTRLGVGILELLKKINPDLDKTLFDYGLAELSITGQIQITPNNLVKLISFEPKLDSKTSMIVAELRTLFLRQKFEPLPQKEIAQIIRKSPSEIESALKHLLDLGEIINLGEGLLIHHDYLKIALEKLIEFLSKNREIRVSEFRDLLGTSRRSALPILQYFDTKGITIRHEDKRILSPKYQKP
ncbi:MAG: selenocysteine-specific translation elongation factor [candidate division WOR-3 bacterium]|nr:selenocysteine-specific translation elongation factor [candidate division WOR-3 bacterium]MDW7987355.1 selenocysteine-specific translation elongation factor [candidate division WOR-3 bacterium]